MSAITIETHLWYCDICDNTINIKSKSKYNNSKTHTQKQKDGIVVKTHEFIDPGIDEVKYKLNDTIKECRSNYFHSFED